MSKNDHVRVVEYRELVILCYFILFFIYIIIEWWMDAPPAINIVFELVNGVQMCHKL